MAALLIQKKKCSRLFSHKSKLTDFQFGCTSYDHRLKANPPKQ